MLLSLPFISFFLGLDIHNIPFKFVLLNFVFVEHKILIN